MDIKTQIAELDVKLNEIREKILPLNERRGVLMRKRDILVDALDKQTVEEIQKEPKEKRAEYFINAVDGKLHTYNAFQKFLREETALSLDGINEMNQFCLRIEMHQDKSNLEAVHDDLMFFLPMLRPNEAGLITFDVMEITLSANDSYWLVYNCNDKAWQFTTGRRLRYNQKPLTANADLKKILSFICISAYYIPIEEEE